MRKTLVIRFIIILFSIFLVNSCNYIDTSKKKDLSLLKNLFGVNYQQFNVVIFNPSDCNICEDKIFHLINKRELDTSTHLILILPELREISKKSWIKVNQKVINRHRVYFNSFLYDYFIEKYNKNEVQSFELVFDQFGQIIKVQKQ